MRLDPEPHGYGQQRVESFQSFYRRSVLSEGCGCAERVLDPSNRVDPGESLLKILMLALIRVRQCLAGTHKPVGETDR